MSAEAANRYLCSNLVSIRLPALGSEERELVGNLEEISSSGAYLNVEKPIDVGLPLRLVCSNRHQSCELKGAVLDCSHDLSTGYYVDVEFSPDSLWSLKLFKPQHLIRTSSLLAITADGPPSETSCCDRGICSKGVLSQLLQPEAPLTGRVRAVAREVASLCGGMTEREAVNCFGSLFGAGPECQLFGEFQEAYASVSQKSLRTRTQADGLVQVTDAVSSRIVKSKTRKQSASG